MLDIQVQSKVIGGVRYDVTPLAAGSALKLAARVARVIAPVIADVSSMAEVKGALGSALSDLLESLDDATVEYLYTTMAPSTIVVTAGARLPLDKCFDEHFRGRVMECLEWLKFALEVNYRPLVERLLSESAPDPAQEAPAK